VGKTVFSTSKLLANGKQYDQLIAYLGFFHWGFHTLSAAVHFSSSWLGSGYST